MDISTINWLAVACAAFASFVIGGLWYSRLLFGKRWQKENSLSDDDLRKNSIKTFSLSLVWALVMSFNLALFLNAPGTTAIWGMTAGFLAGFGWITMGVFTIALFERKTLAYMLINGGYMTVSLTIMGLIIGAWR